MLKRNVVSRLPRFIGQNGYDCFRREPLNEAQDSTFGFLENYHCWRFHGSGVIVTLQIVGLIFFCTGMHHEHFFRSSIYVLSCSPFISKIPKIYNWWMDSGGHSVCFRGRISPLRQWLDSYAKSRLKMCHTFKHFIHMQYFLLLINLVIDFVHWVSTGVLYEPQQCSLFLDYIPESKLCFASICAARPVHIQSDQYRSCSTVIQRRAAVGAAPFIPMGSNQKQRCGSEFAKWYDVYTPEECADEWRKNNANLKLLENCVVNGFIMFGIMFMTATGLENSPQSFDVYTVSQSRSVVTSTENPTPENSPQSIEIHVLIV